MSRNYYIYCRRSSDREDKQVLSTEAQLRILKELAARLNVTVADTFVEDQSAYKTGRPKFNEMMKGIEEGKGTGILTYHLTRLARNSFDGGRIIYHMDDGLLLEIRTPDSVYINKSDDKFMMQIHFAMAKKSSDDTSQFVIRDIESKLLKGEYPGVVPLGYLNLDRAGRIAATQYDPQKQRLLEESGRVLRREEIDPLDGPLMAKLFQEAAKGTHSLKSLAKLAEQLGLRSRKGRKLAHSTIHQLITNPYFCGYIRYNGKMYHEDVQHEPLIDPSLFDRVQQVMCKRGKGRQTRHSFAFTGAMTCGDCGCSITGEIQRGHVYYHCTHRKGDCSQRQYLREEELQDSLASIFERLTIPSEFLSFAFDEVREAHKHEAKLQESTRAKLERQYADAKRKLDALLQMKLSPKNTDGALLSDDEYLAQKSIIQRDIETLSQRLSTEHQHETQWVDDCERFIRFTQALITTFKTGAAARKKELLLLVCSNIVIKDGNVATTYRKPFDLLAEFAPTVSGTSEQSFALAAAEKSDFFERWLHLVDLIRTYTLPPLARKIASASANTAA